MAKRLNDDPVHAHAWGDITLEDGRPTARNRSAGALVVLNMRGMGGVTAGPDGIDLPATVRRGGAIAFRVEGVRKLPNAAPRLEARFRLKGGTREAIAVWRLPGK